MGDNSLCHDLEASKGAATSLLIAVHATADYNIIRSCDVSAFAKGVYKPTVRFYTR